MKECVLIISLLTTVSFLVAPPASAVEIPSSSTNAIIAQPATTHWSFKIPQRFPLPEAKNTGWVRNEIDRFILAKLEQETITPAPEADRETLIRRLSLDLLGLPPAPHDVESFLADRSSDAYEHLVDRLLASPHFGERWGRHWLDLARYADSDGYEKDSARPYAYLFRDWVIRAVNADLPFDQFSIEQLAGDLLPNATDEQRAATGFHRNTLTNKEGGVDQEEFRCKATVDRASTTATVWLGLTLGCAECHNHKYDPITQREFYQFYAFFNNASEKDMPAPQPLELAAYRKQKEAWDGQHKKLQEQLAAYVNNKIGQQQAEWEGTVSLPKTRWTVLAPKAVSSANGTVLRIERDRSITASGKAPDTDTYTIEFEPAEISGLTGFRLEVLDDPALGKGPGRAKNNNFVLSEFQVKAQGPVGAASSSTETTEAPLLAQRVRLQNARCDHAPKDCPVAAAIDGDSRTGWAIHPQFDRNHVAVFETVESVTIPQGVKLVFELSQQYGSQHTIGAFRISATTAQPPSHADLMPDDIVVILERTPSDRTTEEAKRLAEYFRREVDAHARALDGRVAEHKKTEPRFPETKAQTLAQHNPARITNIHIRGDFLRKGDEVQPGTPAVLHAFKSRGNDSDRLDLARWLFDPANPLTGRIAVNHLWQHLFGRGLVPTLEDFGSRGEKPSHPELLDWLATEFPRLGWSRKALIRLIVTSATYRQSSRVRAELMDRDSNNVLLARQNRFRLEAEAVRDSYLAASGLLSATVGGPSVHPPLPADIAALGYANSVKWKESEGLDRYRRGLYIFFQRTVPYPMLMSFDAPDSNVTCTRRERSNTPLQALTLLNDPVFLECAQALGRRAAAIFETNPIAKIRAAFRVCLSREPTTEETERMEILYRKYQRILEASPANAARLAGPSTDGVDVIQTAALVGVCRAILNLDEFVTRE